MRSRPARPMRSGPASSRRSRPPGGAARTGRGRRRADAGHRVDAELLGRGVGHGRGVGGPGRQVLRRAVRADDMDAGRPAGDRQLHGRAGDDGSGGSGSAAHELAGQVREEDRERDLEGQVGVARVEGEDGGRQPGPVAAVEQRRLRRPRDHRPGPVGQGHLAARRRCGPSRGRRSGGSARRGRACRCPGRLSVPVTVPSGDVFVGAIARIGRAGRGSGRGPSKMMRSNFSGCVSRPELVGRDAVELRAGKVGQRRLEVRVAGADQQDPPQPVRRDDRPGPVVGRELVGRVAVLVGRGGPRRRRCRGAGRRCSTSARATGSR